MKNWFAESLRVLSICSKAGPQLAYGVYRLSKLKGPIVSVFGGKGAWEEGKYAAKASLLAAKCVEKKYAILTGGGPGIMEAANCGVLEQLKSKEKAKNWTLGIGVKGVDINFVNPCADVVNVDYFFVRKWLLLRYSCGFAIFPGGIGTADELFDLLNLIKLGKLKPIPIVLIDRAYWNDLAQWYSLGVEKEFIKHAFKELITLTDDVNEAFEVITKK